MLISSVFLHNPVSWMALKNSLDEVFACVPSISFPDLRMKFSWRKPGRGYYYSKKPHYHILFCEVKNCHLWNHSLSGCYERAFLHTSHTWDSNRSAINHRTYSWLFTLATASLYTYIHWDIEMSKSKNDHIKSITNIPGSMFFPIAQKKKCGSNAYLQE